MKLVKVTGTAVLGVLLLFFCFVVYPFRAFEYPPAHFGAVVIQNITVIDVERDTSYPQQTVLIKGGLIQTVSPTALKALPSHSQQVKIIDGTHKFLLPAFWDMHVHLTRQSPNVAYPRFVTHGITHVRDMRGAYTKHDPFAGEQDNLARWNKEVQSYALIGPRLHGFTSFAIEGPHPMFKNSPAFFNCATPQDAVKLVHYFAQKKVTLIKVYDNIPRAAFFSLMQEAKKAGIDVAGHKPLRVSTQEAANAGMKSLEHARFFIWDSFAGAAALRAGPDPERSDNTLLRQQMLHQHDSLQLKDMFMAFKRNHTWYCPTHLTRKADAFADDNHFRARYDSINPVLRFLAFEDLDATIQEDTTALGRSVYQDFYVKGLTISAQAYGHGLKLLAGSDVPELPGSSLHEELGELSKAGLPPYEVLRTATLYPAQYYGLDGLYGSIKPGKKADLVMLAANPLKAIANTGSVVGVLVDGHYLDDVELSHLRAALQERETSVLMTAKLLWDMLVYMVIS